MSLQSEIDRDRTTIDAVFSRMMDLSKGTGEAAENIEPLIGKLERIKNNFFEGAERLKRLPDGDRKKALSPPKVESDDEIPF